MLKAIAKIIMWIFNIKERFDIADRKYQRHGLVGRIFIIIGNCGIVFGCFAWLYWLVDYAYDISVIAGIITIISGIIVWASMFEVIIKNSHAAYRSFVRGKIKQVVTDKIEDKIEDKVEEIKKREEGETTLKVETEEMDVSGITGKPIQNSLGLRRLDLFIGIFLTVLSIAHIGLGLYGIILHW